MEWLKGGTISVTPVEGLIILSKWGNEWNEEVRLNMGE